MTLIASLCSAYHWTVDQAYALTVPQIVMLNHAAHINYERAEAQSESRRKADEKKRREQERLDELDPIMTGGRRLSEIEADPEAWKNAMCAW